MAHRNNMESLELDDAFDESSLELGDVFEESWPNCALVKPELKVKELSNEKVDVSGENSIQSSQNTTYNVANLKSSIKKEKLQSELVSCIERLPSVKAERDINIGKSNYHLSDGNPKDRYLIEECQNEVNFSLMRHVKTEPLIADSEEEESLSTFKKSECNEKTIKEEYFIESEIIVQKELDIKDEDEGEDQFTAKSAMGPIKKKHQPSNRTATLSRISTSNRRFRLTEPSVFKCLDCAYHTYQKIYIARHVRTHMEKYLKCSHCLYKTWDKWRFRQHQLTHVPQEQVKLHQCPECSFTSIWKSGITKHMVKHEKPEDATWHFCTFCCYKSTRKNNLAKHMKRVHRPNDIQLIHCQKEGCSFKTHNRSNLTQHIKAIHDESRKFFKCPKCSFQTKYPGSFKAHKLGHEDRTSWFSCALCPYKTTSTHNLKRHMLVHKKPEEISEWFSCYLCTFRTPRKDTLTAHIRKMHRYTNGQIKNSCNETK